MVDSIECFLYVEAYYESAVRAIRVNQRVDIGKEGDDCTVCRGLGSKAKLIRVIFGIKITAIDLEDAPFENFRERWEDTNRSQISNIDVFVLRDGKDIRSFPIFWINIRVKTSIKKLC